MRLWKKVLATATAGVLCLGSVSVPSLQNVLESVGTVLSVSATVPNEYDGTYGDLYYDVTDAGEITITSWNENAVSVEIPREINGKSVTSVGNAAFKDCTDLTEITIPDSVTSIGEYAFCGCASLTEITIPDGVTSIGDFAFCICTSLTEITIPDSVTVIGY